MGLTITDKAALFIAALLAVNVAWRLRRTRLNSAGLLRMNIAMIGVMILSVSVVFAAIDPLLGGRSLLNCLSHLLMVYAGWEISQTTAEFLQRLDPLKNRSFLVRPWVPIVAAFGVVGSYLALSPGSSRGLDAYDNHPAFVAYWVLTLLPLILGAIHLLPRMVKIAPLLRKANRLTAVTMATLWCSMAGILVSVLFYCLTAMNDSFWLAREIVVTMTSVLFAASFFMATAALPRPTGRTSRHSHREESHTAPL